MGQDGQEVVLKDDERRRAEPRRALLGPGAGGGSAMTGIRAVRAACAMSRTPGSHGRPRGGSGLLGPARRRAVRRPEWSGRAGPGAACPPLLWGRPPGHDAIFDGSDQIARGVADTVRRPGGASQAKSRWACLTTTPGSRWRGPAQAPRPVDMCLEGRRARDGRAAPCNARMLPGPAASFPPRRRAPCTARRAGSGPDPAGLVDDKSKPIPGPVRRHPRTLPGMAGRAGVGAPCLRRRASLATSNHVSAWERTWKNTINTISPIEPIEHPTRSPSSERFVWATADRVVATAPREPEARPAMPAHQQLCDDVQDV